MIKKDFQIYLESVGTNEFMIPKNIRQVTNDVGFISSLEQCLNRFYKYIRNNIKNKFNINEILSSKKDRDGFDREYITYDADVDDNISLDRIHLVFDRHKLALDSRVVYIKYYLYLGSIETIRHGMSHIFLYGSFELVQFKNRIYNFTTEILPFRLVNKYEYNAPIYRNSPRLITGKYYLQSIEKLDMKNPITNANYNIFEDTVENINSGLRDTLSDYINSYIKKYKSYAKEVELEELKEQLWFYKQAKKSKELFNKMIADGPNKYGVWGSFGRVVKEDD